MSPYLSGKALIEHFGGTAELHELAKRHDVPVSYFQIRKWLTRDRVSQEGLIALIQLGERSGRPVNLVELINASADVEW